jgi:hypothetical protein
MKEATINTPSFRALFGILVLIVFSAVGGANAAQTEDAVAKAVDDEVNWLFVMNAKSGSFDGKTLTLHKVPPVLMFADRPYRMWGHMDLDGLIKAVSKGPGSFAEDPPNAVISTFGGELPTSATVVVFAPTVEGDKISFPVDVLEGEIPETFKGVSMFIDAWAHHGGHGGHGHGHRHGHAHWHPHVGALVVGAAIGSAAAHSSSSTNTVVVQQPAVVVQQPSYYYQASPPPAPAPAPKAAAAPAAKNPQATLEELHNMYTKGLITESDYDTKKAAILKQM